MTYEQIYRNLPGNPNWETSFYETLTERCIWDVDEFWKLHLDLTDAARHAKQSELMSRDLALCVSTLQLKIGNLLCAHFNGNDVFKIANLSTDEIYQFKERFELAVLGVFSGEVIPETSFDLVNPLLG